MYFTQDLQRRREKGSIHICTFPVIFGKEEQIIVQIDVYKLIDSSYFSPEVCVSVNSIKHYLNDKVWETTNEQDGTEVDISPMEVLENPELSEYHWNRILEADTNFAILVVRNNDEENTEYLLDGNHRLAKAVYEKHDFIQVKIVNVDDVIYARLR